MSLQRQTILSKAQLTLQYNMSLVHLDLSSEPFELFFTKRSSFPESGTAAASEIFSNCCGMRLIGPKISKIQEHVPRLLSASVPCYSQLLQNWLRLNQFISKSQMQVWKTVAAKPKAKQNQNLAGKKQKATRSSATNRCWKSWRSKSWTISRASTTEYHGIANSLCCIIIQWYNHVPEDFGGPARTQTSFQMVQKWRVGPQPLPHILTWQTCATKK